MKFDVVVPVHCDLLDHSGQDHLLDVQRGFFVYCPVLDVLVVGGAGCDPGFLVLRFILAVRDFLLGRCLRLLVLFHHFLQQVCVEGALPSDGFHDWLHITEI